MLLGSWLLDIEPFDDWTVDRLLAGRLEVADVDLDTPLFRKELVRVLLSVAEVGLLIVTSTILVKVTNLEGIIVTVVIAVRLDLIVVVRRAVELTVLVEI